jgi:16S rRNA (adenine1518-N6/adenine1519-N6)-dimethyltransferase
MSELNRIQNLLKEYGLYAKKSFGQNFLINEGIIKRIVNKMEIETFPTVIEIGPGLGSLTLPISQKAKKLIAVDADRDMVMVLNQLFKDNKNTTIVQSDFLRFDPDEYSSMEDRLLIGNLPYNITSELLEYMLEKGFRSAGMMVQKEVADKLDYVKGKKDNCPLGAFIKMTGDLTLISDVDSSSFSPAPKVQSAFIRIDQKQKIDFNLYPIVKAMFKDPNKTIGNCLKQTPNYSNALSYLKESQNEFLSYRARQLEASELHTLAKLIKEHL